MFKIIGLSLVVLLLSLIVPLFLFMTNIPADEMASNGLLFLSNAAKVHNMCLKASKFVQNILYIKIKGSSENFLSEISRQIITIYSKTPAPINQLDIRLMLKPHNCIKKLKTNFPIDLILYDSDLEYEMDNLRKSIDTLSVEHKVQSICSPETSQEQENNEEVKTYEYVALGGTFDRLHNGHKILLSQAALRATKQLTVGVADINLIQTKKLWELIEPLEARMKAVLKFLTDINPDLEYHVFPLQDIYGPTKDDPKFQLIVVSEETLRGANKINEKRRENGFDPMDVHVIALAEDKHPQRVHGEEEDKVSSSNQRMRLLGTLLRPPKPNPAIPDWPYVIGLAGGIASGKSNIMQKLKAKGAAVVNCDIIAHELYEPGMPLNQTLSETFGKHIITENGEVDRKVLGSIVFSDHKQLEKLNALMWPAVIEEAQKRIRVLGEQGYKVVVMEAAVMVGAKWYNYCHQLWSVIIPPAEAIKRLQERNSLSEEEAKKRIEAQPSNQEQVEHANIVFSPYWSYEYTQMQIDRAWQHLQEYLKTRQ